VPRYGHLEESVASRSSSEALIAEWIAPSGRSTTTRGFPGGGALRVRFSPDEIGVYRFRLSVERDGIPTFVREGEFEAVTSGEHGPVHADDRRPFRLSYADGTPFFILGENRINIYDPTWNYGRKNIAEYVAYMADNGMTTLRVFVPSDCESEEAADHVQIGCIEPKIGQFDERAARVFDAIFDAAEKRGIYVVLAINAIGFTPNDTWKSWDDNPYARARGGPASTPIEAFTRDDLFEAAARKVDYVVARYAASSHLLAIDLLNEPEWDGAIPEKIWIPWAERLARHLRSVDPYRHLITAGSVGLSWNIDGDERALYADPSLDLVQWHLYGKETYEPHAHALEMSRRMDETRSFGKPVFCGEFAYGGEDPLLYDHTHTGLWAAIFSGGGALAHSAPPFNLDSDEPMTPARAHHFAILAGFLRSLDLRENRTAERLHGSPAELDVWSLGRSDDRALWVLAPRRGYGSLVTDGEIVLHVDDGAYAVRWIDDTTGAVTRDEPTRSQGGRLTLKLPPFRRHLAATVRR
jgi:hypothetical protein